MLEKFENANPPMNANEKQAALSDRMKLSKTMASANKMIEKKFKPKGTAQSHSPFLMANAVGFDSIKMLNKMDEDKKIREEHQLKIAQELKNALDFTRKKTTGG